MLVNGLFNGKYILIVIPKKTGKKFFFSRKSNNCSHPPVTLNNSAINKYSHHKHLGIVLDSKLVLKFHVG